MELVVRVEQVLEPVSFTKRDGTVNVRNSFVGIYTNNNYEKKLKFDVMNQEAWGKMNIQVGGNYSVSFDLESREWQGKWFTSCNVWKTYCLDGKQMQHTQAEGKAPTPTAEAQDGVPF